MNKKPGPKIVMGNILGSGCIDGSETTLSSSELSKSSEKYTKKDKKQSSSRVKDFNSIEDYLKFHSYKIGEVLGEGSYSKVKLCTRFHEDGTPAYRFACKIIKKKVASDDFVTKFLPRELDILQRIEHPNIVHVFDIAQFGSKVYIFMDACELGDLLEYVKKRGQFSENRTRFYLKQLTSAVRYLHNLDIAHRDLKCENILLGSCEQLKLSDFGFARYCHDPNSGKRILSNTYCGSAAYAAPEILQGTAYNPKLYDMWSLGCVLFIMLTGHMPFDESNIPKMLKNQLTRDIAYPSAVVQSLTPLAKNLVGRLLEPDVTRRANIDQVLTHEWVRPSNPILAPFPRRPLTASAAETKIKRILPKNEQCCTNEISSPGEAPKKETKNNYMFGKNTKNSRGDATIYKLRSSSKGVFKNKRASSASKKS